MHEKVIIITVIILLPKINSRPEITYFGSSVLEKKNSQKIYNTPNTHTYTKLFKQIQI